MSNSWFSQKHFVVVFLPKTLFGEQWYSLKILMQELYLIESQIFDSRTTINRSWYTREYQVSTLMFILTKEQLEIDKERDQNMDNIRTKLDILSKIFVGVFVRSVNIVVVRCVNLYETKFESLYNDEVNFLANKGCSYHSNYTM